MPDLRVFGEIARGGVSRDAAACAPSLGDMDSQTVKFLVGGPRKPSGLLVPASESTCGPMGHFVVPYLGVGGATFVGFTDKSTKSLHWGQEHFGV